MIITLNDVQKIFRQLINGDITREEADYWAYKRTEESDARMLEYNPRSDHDLIWDAISYLHGIDMQISPGEYLLSDSDIKETFEEKWNRPSKP